MGTFSYLLQTVENSNQVDTFSNNIINEIINGKVDVLQVLSVLKHIEKVSEIIFKHDKVKEIAIKEAQKYNKNEKVFNAVFNVSERKEYDYSENNEWNNLNKEIEMLKKQQKELEEKIKSLKVEMADVSSGEIFKPAKIKDTKTILSVTIKK